MDWKKAIGLGITLWILMFVVVSVFIAFKLYIPGEPNIIVVFVAGVVSYVLAGYAKPSTSTEALYYGAAWVGTGVLLDTLITMRFSADIFQMWTLWLGYGLVLIAPILTVKKA